MVLLSLSLSLSLQCGVAHTGTDYCVIYGTAYARKRVYSLGPAGRRTPPRARGARAPAPAAGGGLSLAVQWGVAIEIERAIKKSARFC